MMQHEGPARVFNSEEEAVEAILSNRILPGDVIVIRYEGPRGPRDERNAYPYFCGGRYGPGQGGGINHRWTILWGDPWSFHRPCISRSGGWGPIALVEEGDRIRIDILANRLELLVDEQELSAVEIYGLHLSRE